jgi:hypothetical protein
VLCYVARRYDSPLCCIVRSQNCIARSQLTELWLCATAVKATIKQTLTFKSWEIFWKSWESFWMWEKIEKKSRKYWENIEKVWKFEKCIPCTIFCSWIVLFFPFGWIEICWICLHSNRLCFCLLNTLINEKFSSNRYLKGIVSPDWKGLQMISLDRFEV